MVTTYRILFVSAVLLAGCSKVDPPRSMAELDWIPNTDQPIRQLTEVLDATEGQQPRNYTSSNLGFVLDAKLYILFNRYLDTLGPDDVADAIEEQGLWLDQRRAATSAASAQYEGGSLASYAGNSAFIDATQQRIVEIESRMP